jgi:hypothetical protein
MRREDLDAAIRFAGRCPRALVLLLVIALGASCRETDPAPQPKSRVEATKQGHSAAARTRPAWVDEPKAANARTPTSMPPGWVPAGRGSWVLGRMTMLRTQRLGEISGDPKQLEGKQARVRAPLRLCPGEKTLVRLEDAGQQLVSRLPGELPQWTDGQRAVIEGELRRPASEEEAKAAERCLGKERPALLLRASGMLVHLPAEGR